MSNREKIIKGLEETEIVLAQAVDRGGEMAVMGAFKCLNRVIDAISMLKEQESEAKWIYGEDKTGVDGWYCSECDFFEPWFYEFTDDIDFIRFYGYCPRCGRRMTSYTGKPTQEGR